MRLQPVRFALPSLVIGAIVLLGADISHRVMAAFGGLGLGPAPYATYAHEAVAPALVAGLLLACSSALVFFGEALAKANRLRGGWLDVCAQSVARISWVRFLALTIPLQLATLVGMESLEQTIAFGHPLGLAGALGGPVLIALMIHIVAGAAVTLAMLLGARAVVAAGSALARAVAPLMRRLPAPSVPRLGALKRAHDGRALVAFLTPLARRIANRPPPLAISPA